MKRFNEMKNVCGNILKQAREEKHYSKEMFCRKLQLPGVNFDRTEIYRIEKNQLFIKILN